MTDSIETLEQEILSGDITVFDRYSRWKIFAVRSLIKKCSGEMYDMFRWTLDSCYESM